MYFLPLCNSLQSFQSLHIIATDKDIDVLPDLAVFIQHTVAESGVLLAKRIENIANGRKFAGKADLNLAVRKRFQMPAEMNDN